MNVASKYRAVAGFHGNRMFGGRVQVGPRLFVKSAGTRLVGGGVPSVGGAAAANGGVIWGRRDEGVGFFRHLEWVHACAVGEAAWRPNQRLRLAVKEENS